MQPAKPISQTLFISDLHLSEANAHLNALFRTLIENLLQKTTQVDALYILGDFFDVWLGDDIAGSWEKSIIEQLSLLVKSGIPVYFMQGNRDFLLGQPFLQLAQCVLLPDPAKIMLYGKQIVLKHGDDLCQDDRKYQCFRRFVRMSWIKKQYLNLPVIWRRRIAASIRQKSQARGMRDIYSKVSTKLVNALLQDADTLIHGHTHCPQIENILVDGKVCQHIILSDWHQQGNMLVVSSDGMFKLDYFDVK